MSSLNFYGYNSRKIDGTYQNVSQNVEFLLDVKQIPRSSKNTLGI